MSRAGSLLVGLRDMRRLCMGYRCRTGRSIVRRFHTPRRWGHRRNRRNGVDRYMTRKRWRARGAHLPRRGCCWRMGPWRRGSHLPERGENRHASAVRRIACLKGRHGSVTSRRSKQHQQRRLTWWWMLSVLSSWPESSIPTLGTQKSHPLSSDNLRLRLLARWDPH